MKVDAIIWTEGKTDVQHLKRAADVLKFARSLRFETANEMGDAQLLKECQIVSKYGHPQPMIFIFDRDNRDIITKVGDDAYKAWGNNVFSFAIPIPDHRSSDDGVCIELYFNHQNLTTRDPNGRRIFLSSEFSTISGRHLTDDLNVGNKGRLQSGKILGTRILDTDVYDSNHTNVALSKADFADYVEKAIGPFGMLDFRHFEKIFAVINQILLLAETSSVDLPTRDPDEVKSLQGPAGDC
jgi:RNA-directed DNA polymerase